MKRPVQYLALSLLFTVALASLVRSWRIVADPGGSYLYVPLDILGNETPVDHYLPVHYLYGVFGLFYLMVSIMVFFRLEGHKVFTLVAGAMMCILIPVRISFGQAFVAQWHIPLFVIGLVLIVAGAVMMNTRTGKH